MLNIIPIDELPTGQFAIMFYEIHITDEKNRTVITARDLVGTIYTFYANAFLDYIKSSVIFKFPSSFFRRKK